MLNCRFRFGKCMPLVLTLFLSPVVHAADGVFVGINQGTAVGSVLGGIIGYQVDRRDGAVVGSILGAIAGSAIHRDRHREYHKILAFESNRQRLRQQALERIETESMSLVYRADDLFIDDSALLQADQKFELDSLAADIKATAGASVVIEGHTDDSGDAYPNLIKSLSRAQAVATQLVIRGVPRAWIAVNGQGETQPLVDNSTAENQQLNRRINIDVRPLLTPLELSLVGVQ